MYRGVYTAPPNADEGIQMVYLPDRQVIRMDGWHSGRKGALQPVDISLGDFLSSLGISLADCQSALGGGNTAAPQMTVAGQPTQRAASEEPPRTTGTPSEAPPRVR